MANGIHRNRSAVRKMPDCCDADTGLLSNRDSALTRVLGNGIYTKPMIPATQQAKPVIVKMLFENPAQRIE
jgi:hypothetical protein